MRIQFFLTSQVQTFSFIKNFLPVAGMLACLLLSNIANAEDWPQFLGPHRNGISVEKGLLTEWPSNGPKEVWRTKVDIGLSGIAVVKDQLLTLVQSKNSQCVLCLDATTGKQRWIQPFADAYQNQMGNGPRSTPTIVGDQVFVFGSAGTLAALTLKDGKLLWKHQTVKDFKGAPAEYGIACSPLVVKDSVEDMVIVTPGVTAATVAAYSRKTGKLLWNSGNELSGYASPNLLTVGGQEQIVVASGKSIMGLATGTGKQLWQFPFVTDFNCNVVNPIAYQGKLFYSAGENHGASLVALNEKDGSFSASEVWKSHGPKSVMRNEWQTSIIDGKYLYGFDNVGGAGPVTHLNCINIETGEQQWHQSRFGKGNFIAADGKLFISTMKGELIIAEINPKEYTELGRMKIFDGSRQAPALSNGRLYLRGNKEVVCVDVRKQ